MKRLEPGDRQAFVRPTWNPGHDRPVRFLMVGGFLGAGKTTAIAWLAKRLVDRGLRVGLITNDQGHDLVDTRALRSRGFPVGEIAGACFCCRFDGLLGVLEDLGREHAPDVVITEPVGSCTDLVATVIEPLRRLHADAYAVGPLAVLLKPEHARRLLQVGADAARWAGTAWRSWASACWRPAPRTASSSTWTTAPTQPPRQRWDG